MKRVIHRKFYPQKNNGHFLTARFVMAKISGDQESFENVDTYGRKLMRTSFEILGSVNVQEIGERKC